MTIKEIKEDLDGLGMGLVMAFIHAFPPFLALVGAGAFFRFMGWWN